MTTTSIQNKECAEVAGASPRWATWSLKQIKPLKPWLLSWLCLGALMVSGVVQAQTIQTVAGNGTAGFGGDSGAATSAPLSSPHGVALDSAGNLYIADTGNYRIRKIAADGTISTVAGDGISNFGGDGGPATSAQLYYPFCIALDSAGNLYIADPYDFRIRKIATNGTISTVAGGLPNGFSGDGGPAASAQLNFPFGIALSSAGNLYIADTYNNRIRKVAADGSISTVAGDGTAAFGGDGGPATSAQLASPYGIALDSADNLYIADTNNHRIRKVATNGTISTVAGSGTPGFGGDGGAATSAQLFRPENIAVDSAGHLYIADTNNQRIRKVASDGTISTLAGTGTTSFGGDGGPANSAQLFNPNGIALDSSGNLYITDTGNNRIRKTTNLAPNSPTSLTATAGNAAVELTWLPPASDGGSAITSYEVTALPGGASCTTASPAASCVVTALTNGAAYSFTVKAISGVGTSPASSPVTATPLLPIVAPSAPTAATALPFDGAVQVSWTAPASNGGSAITGYLVEALPGSKSCTATPPATSCVVAGLTNATPYSFTVKAINGVGTSPASLAATATPVAPLAQTLPLPGGAGNASVLISGGQPGCSVAPGDLQFGNTAPPNAPAQAALPLGVLSFTAKGCAGATLNVAITYPAGSLAGLTMFKVGPNGLPRQTGWFTPPGLTVSGDTVRYTVQDDGDGDSDTTTPGNITDPFAPVLLAAAPASVQPVPTLGQWALVLLSLMAAALGMGTLRRRTAVRS